MRDLFPPDPDGQYGREGRPHVAPPPPRAVAWYDYHDEGGKLLYQVVRFDPKDFRQRRPDGRGGWLWGLGDQRRVLFRLPQVLQWRDFPVVVVEGEKDVLALERLRLLATCNPGGTGMGWLDDYSRSLAGRRVAVVPDNDAAGWQHAYRVVGSLLRHGAASVRLVELPGLPERGDVSDWVGRLATTQGRLVRPELGHLMARDDLARVIARAPEWAPKQQRT